MPQKFTQDKTPRVAAILQLGSNPSFGHATLVASRGANVSS